MKLTSLSHPEPHSTIPWVTWRKHVRNYKLMLSLDLLKASQKLLPVLRSHWWKLGALIWSRVFNSHYRIFNQMFIHQFVKIHFGPSDVNISYQEHMMMSSSLRQQNDNIVIVHSRIPSQLHHKWKLYLHWLVSWHWEAVQQNYWWLPWQHQRPHWRCS